MTDNPPQFPNYSPPNPSGIPIADPQLHKPLMKMIKTMWKPQRMRDPFHSRRKPSRKVKKQQPYY